ncbi:hypothetical protein AXF42_Ash010350 [Apostasia shenzhenica]|uniref:Uncharacterized protein n=1 Tax=Apostasia shenzhenica TaxID=1088818 RepID=A0A2I0BDS2_9ASPA|nr:hypothetical protein AXF42_Ash010350 [Apostasia shenzhenica]
MENFLKLHGKEGMKRAMLEQEDTFRQQVHELHRLYRVQKHLMKEIKMNKIKKQWVQKNLENKAVCSRIDKTRPQRLLDLELPAEAYMEDERELIELTLATGSSCRRKTETYSNNNTSDSAGSFSSSSELRELELFGHGWGNPKRQDIYLTAHRERNSGFDVERRLQQPPWLLPRLSLKMS